MPVAGFDVGIDSDDAGPFRWFIDERSLSAPGELRFRCAHYACTRHTLLLVLLTLWSSLWLLLSPECKATGLATGTFLSSCFCF